MSVNRSGLFRKNPRNSGDTVGLSLSDVKPNKVQTIRSGVNNRTRYSPGAPGHQQTLSDFKSEWAEVEHCATVGNKPQLPPPEHHGLSDG